MRQKMIRRKRVLPPMPSLLSLLAAVAAAASLPGRRDVHYYSASAFLPPSASVVPPSSSRTTMRRVSSSAFDAPPPRLREGGCRDGADDGTTTTSTVPPPAAVLGPAVDGVVVGRRVAAGRLSSLLAAALAATTAAAPGAALASPSSSSDLFRPNPLTNPVLEKIRIWNQDEADNVVYGGELASGSSKPDGLDVYVGLLQPILGVERDLSEVDALLRKSKGGGGGGGGEGALLAEIEVVLSKSKFDKLEFKRSFNAFADNIYYSDPDRANLYLGGGAMPKASQSIAYLLRNEILTDVEDMRAEVRYLAGEVGKGGATAEGIIDLDEMYRLSESANVGMRKYLDLVPPRELAAARAEFSASPCPPSAP